MIILGIDPGSITTGYAFVKTAPLQVLEYGTLHAKPNQLLEDRLLYIVSELELLLDKYHPNSLGMEGIFFAKNARSALILGHVRGAIMVACRKRGLTYCEYSPREIKQAVTGNGASSKEVVANMVFARFGIKSSNLPLDASDALAIAWTHANPLPVNSALEALTGKVKHKKKASNSEWVALAKKMGAI